MQVFFEGTMKAIVDGKEVEIESVDIRLINATPSEPPEPVDPVEPTEPMEPSDPAEPPPAPTGGLLADEAVTMAPGEWRNLAAKTTWPGKDTGTTFKGFQYVGIADGMGWTQPAVYHNGALMMLLCRDQGEQALLHMDSAGNFSRIDEPVGFGADGTRNGGRRPFHRLMQDAEYLYFAPRGGKTTMGHLIRTPLDNPGVFEVVGPDIGDDQMDTTGNFSMIWVEEWGRFYAFTPGGNLGGKIWSRAPADTGWTLHPRMDQDVSGFTLSGFSGQLIWNPIKQEIMVSGGQQFGDSPQTSYKAYRITSPLGKPEMLADRRYPDGTLYYWQHGNSKCIIHPADGSYLFHWREPGVRWQWYRSVTGGGTMHLFDDFDAIRPWGGYESFAVLALIPGTNVYAYISHIEGLGLYRPKALDGLPMTPETDPIPLAGGEPQPEPEPDPNLDPEPNPDPLPTDDGIEVLAAATPPGSITPLGGSFAPYGSYREYWKAGGHSADQDTFGPTAFWDSNRRKLIYVRDRTPQWSNDAPPLSNVQVKLYDAATQAWTMGDMSSVANVAIGSPHSYCRQALDQVRGHAYYGAGGSRIVRYLLDANAWEVFDVTSPIVLDGIAPCGYHEALDMLIRPQSQDANPKLGGWVNGSAAWVSLGSLNGHQGYQSLIRYNRVRRDMLLVGGYPQNPRSVTLITESGEIVSKNPIPIGADEKPIFSTAIGGGYAALFYDPVSGNYLYKSGNKFWEYSPDLDEWRLAIDFDLESNKYMIPGPYYGWVMAPVDELGVIAWMSYYGTSLYRHRSVF